MTLLWVPGAVLLILLLAAIRGAKWLVDPPQWTLFVLYAPAILRGFFSVKTTRRIIISTILANALALAIWIAYQWAH